MSLLHGWVLLEFLLLIQKVSLKLGVMMSKLYFTSEYYLGYSQNA